MGNNMGEWISVLDRLPTEDTLTLCIGSKGGMFLGIGRHGSVNSDGTCFMMVPNCRGGRYAKYWMPLPEPPKVNDN